MDRLFLCKKNGSDRVVQVAHIICNSIKSDKAVGAVNAEISAAYLERSRLSFKAESLKNTLQETSEQLENLAADRKDTEKNKENADKELEKLTKEQTRKKDSLGEKENVLGGMTKLLEKRREKLESAVDRFAKAESALTETVSRLNILKDLERSMEGSYFRSDEQMRHYMVSNSKGSFEREDMTGENKAEEQPQDPADTATVQEPVVRQAAQKHRRSAQ